MNLFKIALCNIKKRKAGMITLFLMIVIASLMLMLGLNVVFGLKDYFLKKTAELNSPQFVSYCDNIIWQDKMYDYTKEYQGVTIVEKEQAFQDLDTIVDPDGINSRIVFIAQYINSDRKISPLKIIDRLAKLPDDAVVAPLYVKLNGFKSGDVLKVNIRGKTYSFTIYGFFEDTEFGSSQMSYKRFYFSDSVMDIFLNDGLKSTTYLAARFNDVDIAKKFQFNFQNTFHSSAYDIWILPLGTSEAFSVSFISTISAFILLVAAIIVLISLIIVRFNIINSIEDDTVNFGALKSTGYTNRQILTSIILQYMLIAAFACVLGALLTTVFLPVVGNIVTSSSGLLWLKDFNFLPILVTTVFMLLAAGLISFFTGLKIKKITPVNALRSGIESHNYKKNKAAMSKNKMPLQLNIGIKNLLNNTKNNITIFLVTVLFVLASLIGLIFQYNFSADRSALYNMFGDINLKVQFNTDDYETYVNEILADDRVSGTVFLNYFNINYEDTNIQVQVCENYDLKDINLCYEGRYPKFANEISISGTFAKKINKKKGDIITLNLFGSQQDFIISGLTQSFYNGGLNFELSYDGLKRFDENYKLKMIAIKLKDKNNIEEFKNDYTDKLKNAASIVDDDKMIESVINSLSITIQMVFAFIIISAATVISLVLFLLISTLIRKNKKNIGIMKALGYSNAQLIRQIIYTFIPIIIFAAAAGLVFSLLIGNSLVSLALRASGIMKSHFKIPVILAVLTTILIIIFSAVISVLVALKTKRISAIKLIVE